MEFGDLLNFAYECLYFLIVFGIFFLMAIIKGRQAIINVIVGLYLALLLSVHFPYYDRLLSWTTDPKLISVTKLVMFFVFATFAVWLFYRIMPSEFRENKFESFGKKILLALSATVLVMVFCFNVLPVTEFLSPGTPIQSIFGPHEYFFWWLILPLVVMFLV